MSFVTTQPEALTTAAGALQGLGSGMAAKNAAAAAPTTGVVPAAADEVSALTAAQFAAHGAHVPGDQCPSHGDSRDVCEHPGRPAPLRMRPPRPPTRPRPSRQRSFQPWITGRYRRRSTPRGCMRGRVRSRWWPLPRPGMGWPLELHSAASSYESMISELTDESWTGPASTAMAAAVAPYVAWMSAPPQQAEQTAEPGQGGGGRLSRQRSR